MAETFERLGIQLELEPLKGDPTQVLATLKKTLSEIAEVVKGLNLDKLGNIKMDGISSELKKAKDSAKGTKDGLVEVAKAVSDINNNLNSQSKYLQYVGRDFNEFFKENKKQFLAMAEGSDSIAKKMASPYYQEMMRLREEAKTTAKSINESLSSKGLSVQQMGVKQSQALDINEAKGYAALSYMGKDADGAYLSYLKNQIVSTNTAISDTINNLKVKAIETKLTVLDVANAFKQAGVNIEGLSPEQLNKLNASIKVMGFALADAKGKFKQITPEANFLSEAISRMTKRLLEFYSIRTVIFAVSSEFKEATKAALDLNQAVHDILAISGESKDSFSSIKDSIYSLATTSRYSAQEIANLMQVLAQAGVMGKDLAQVSKQVSLFATGTAADPKVAADLVTTSMNVYNIKANESARITNSLTAALNLSKLEAGGLATAFNYLAPQAAQLGMTMEQTLGIISNMAQSGIKASTIGTGGSQLLKELSAPKARLKSMLEAYGIDPDSVNPMKHEFADIVETLQKAKVSVDDLFQAMDTRVARSAVTAINLTGASFREMTNNVTGTHAALLAYDKSMDGARARINTLKQEVNLLASNVGGILAPAFIVGIDIIKTFVDILNTGSGKFAAIVVSIGAVTASLVTLNLAARSLTSLGLLSTAFTSWNTLIPILKIGMMNLSLVFSGMVPITEALSLAFKSLMTPVNVVSLVLIAVGAAIGGLLYAMGQSRRDFEAQEKATLQLIDKNEQLSRSYESVAKSTDGLQKDLDNYLIAKKQNNKAEEEAILTKRRDLELTDAQRKEISKNIAVGDTLIQGLLQQGKTFEALIAIKEKTIDTNDRLVASEIKVYSNLLKEAQIKALKKEIGPYKAQQLGILSTDEDGYENINYANIKKNMSDEQIKKITESAQNQKVKTNIFGFGGVKLNETKSLDIISAQTRVNPQTDKKEMLSFDEFGMPYWAELKTPKKPSKGKWEPNTGQTTKAQESYAAYAEAEINKMRAETAKASRKTAEDILKDTKDTYEHMMQAYEIAEDLINKEEIASKKKVAAVEGKKFASTHKGVKYDEQTDTLTGVDKNSKDYKKYQELLQARNLEIEAIADKEYAKLDKALVDRKKKSSEAYNKELEKIDEDSAKRQSDLAKKNLDQQFKSEFTTAEDRIQAYYDYLAAAYEKISIEYDKRISDFDKLHRAKYGSKLTEEQKAEYKKAIEELNNSKEDAKVKVKVETDTMINSASDSNIARKEKYAGYDLANAQAVIALKKSQAVTGNELNRLEAENERAVLKSYEAKQRVYSLEFNTQAVMTETSRANLAAGLSISETEKQQISIYEDKKQKLTEINNLIEQQKIKVKEANDESFMGNFEQGLRKGSQSLGSFKSMTQDLGSSVVSTFSGDMTNALTGMVDALGRGENAWKSFASTMGNMLKSIGDMLVKYVMQLMVVWAVQQLVGLAMGSGGGGTTTSTGVKLGGWTSPSTTGFSFLPKAEGGIIQHFANGGLSTLGGFIPNNIGIQGKDSVPAMLMPGEYVIKKDMVDLYGVDYLKALNQGKIQKFAEGGSVGATTTSSGSSNSSKDAKDGTPYSFSIINVADVNSIPPIDGQAVVNIVSFDAAKKGPTYHTIKGVMQG